MNAISPLVKFPKSQPLVPFGPRPLLVLIAAALIVHFARQEVAKEQRREELIAEYQAKTSGFSINPRPSVPGRRKLAAWLRGRPTTPDVERMTVTSVADPATFREFVEAFPETTLDVHLEPSVATPHVMETLTRAKVLGILALHGGLFDTSDESLARLARIRVSGMLMFGGEQLDDDLLRRVAEAKINPSFIWGKNFSLESIGWENVTSDGLRTAATFRRLQYLSACEKGSDEGLAAFMDHPAARYVEVRGPGYTDASAPVIASWPQLDWLTLVDTKLTDAGIAKAIERHAISSLKIKRADIGKETVAAIAELKALQQLELHDIPLTAELVAAIEKLSVTSLTLKGDYTDADLNQLAPIASKLWVFELNAPNVTDHGLAWLAGAGTLSSLKLCDTAATAATLKLISTKNPSVNIQLGGPNIDRAAIAEINRSFKVGPVVLTGPSITDEVLAALTPPYDHLLLVGTQVTAKGLQSLETGSNTTRVEIYFPNNAQPPLTTQEVDEIKAATSGLVQITLSPIAPKYYESMLPTYSRKPVQK